MKGSARATELEYCLSQRAADITSDRPLQLFKTMGTAETGILNNVCSEELLYTFAKDLNGAKKGLHATTQIRMIRNTRLFYGLFRKIILHISKTPQRLEETYPLAILTSMNGARKSFHAAIPR